MQREQQVLDERPPPRPLDAGQHDGEQGHHHDDQRSRLEGRQVVEPRAERVGRQRVRCQVAFARDPGDADVQRLVHLRSERRGEQVQTGQRLDDEEHEVADEEQLERRDVGLAPAAQEVGRQAARRVEERANADERFRVEMEQRLEAFGEQVGEHVAGQLGALFPTVRTITLRRRPPARHADPGRRKARY